MKSGMNSDLLVSQTRIFIMAKISYNTNYMVKSLK